MQRGSGPASWLELPSLDAGMSWWRKPRRECRWEFDMVLSFYCWDHANVSSYVVALLFVPSVCLRWTDSCGTWNPARCAR